MVGEQEEYRAADPAFIYGPGGYMIAGGVGGDSRAGVAFGFSATLGNGTHLVHYYPDNWPQLQWQFTTSEGELRFASGGSMVIETDAIMTYAKGSFSFDFNDGSRATGEFDLIRPRTLENTV